MNLYISHWFIGVFGNFVESELGLVHLYVLVISVRKVVSCVSAVTICV